MASDTPPPLPPLLAEPYVPEDHTISYALAARGRPGIVTTMGIMSIVLGSMALVVGVGAGIWTIVALVSMSLMNTMGVSPVPVAGPPTPSPVVASAASDAGDASAQRFADVFTLIAPRGMRSLDRAIVLDALETVRPLNSARREHLDALFSACGADILGTPGVALSTESVVAIVGGSGTLPGANGVGATYFLLPGGRVEATDTQANFRSSDGTSTVRTAMGRVSDDAGLNTLPPSFIEAVLLKIETLDGQALDSAQAQAIAGQLQDSAQLWIIGAPTLSAALAQLTSATFASNGSVTVVTPFASGTFAKGGGYTTTATNTVAPWTPGPRIPTAAAPVVLIFIEAFFSIGLAIYLLVIGIFALRQSLSARRLHMLYAWLKLLAVVIGLVGWSWWMSDLRSSAGNSTGGTQIVASELATFSLMMFSILIGLSAIYPFVLLFVLRSKSVREYYGTT